MKQYSGKEIIEMIKINELLSDINILGRTVCHNDTLWLGYSLTGIEFDFCGKSLSVELSTDWVMDEPWKGVFQPYIGVVVDGKLEKRFAVAEGDGRYELYSAEKSENVHIELVKLSENAFSKVGVIGLDFDGNITRTKSDKKLKIEFIGDSITCGFGIEGKSISDSFTTATENPFINYASLTAKALNADYRLISWTAIGVYSNSVKDEAVTEPDNGWTMPVIYDYTDKGTELMLGKEPQLWDFSAYQPNIIVVNLGTNDKDFTRGIPERTAAFEKCYREFILHIREKNPNAYILCTLGAMGQELCPQIENAVDSIGDERISSMRFDIQLEEDGIGAEAHPNEVTHRKMADKLISEIKNIL